MQFDIVGIFYLKVKNGIEGYSNDIFMRRLIR